MAKKLLVNEAAEREANEVAERFMNSADVLRDMRGEYGSRLDALQLHDDEEAQEKVRAVRRDAVARGRDIYFGRGILQSRAPEAKGLIAHEVAHTMQQDGYGGMSGHISFGEEQGGLLDWFKGRRKKKEEPAAQPSVKKEKEIASIEPEEVLLAEPLPATAKELFSPVAAQLRTLETSKEQPEAQEMAKPKGLMDRIRRWLSGRETEEPLIEISNPTPGQASDGGKEKSAMILEMARAATPRQARNPELQRMVLQNYNESINKRLLENKGDVVASRGVFRDDDDAKRSLKIMMDKLLPEGFENQVKEKLAEGGPQAVLSMVSDIVDRVELNESGQDVGLGNFLAGAYDAFEGSDLADDSLRSAMMMNNLMLRSVGPALTKSIKSDAFTEEGRAERNAANSVLKTANQEFNTVMEQGGKSAFSDRLLRRFRRK